MGLASLVLPSDWPTVALPPPPWRLLTVQGFKSRDADTGNGRGSGSDLIRQRIGESLCGETSQKSMRNESVWGILGPCSVEMHFQIHNFRGNPDFCVENKPQNKDLAYSSPRWGRSGPSKTASLPHSCVCGCPQTQFFGDKT